MSTIEMLNKGDPLIRMATAVVDKSIVFIDFSNDSFKLANCESIELKNDARAENVPGLEQVLEGAAVRLRPAVAPGWAGGARFGPALFLLALGANLSARIRLRSRGLRDIFESTRRCRGDAARPTDEARLRTAVSQFLRANGIFSWKDDPKDCLPRSIALHGFLNRIGLPAEMKIGVRLAPFSSHAWVELDRRPVLDRAEDVAEYHVILSL